MSTSPPLSSVGGEGEGGKGGKGGGERGGGLVLVIVGHARVLFLWDMFQ